MILRAARPQARPEADIVGMRVMDQALTVGLDFPDGQAATLTRSRPRPDLAPIHGGVPGASGPLGRCALVYMDDCLVHSPTLEQHLLDVAEVLEIFRRRKLYVKTPPPSGAADGAWQPDGAIRGPPPRRIRASTR